MLLQLISLQHATIKFFFVIFKQKCVENEVWELIFINNVYIEKSECK